MRTQFGPETVTSLGRNACPVWAARPSRTGALSRYRKDDATTRRTVGHGIVRMAQSNPEQAAFLWRRYHNTLSFGEARRKHIEGKLLLELARADQTSLFAQAHELPLGKNERLFREVTLSLLRLKNLQKRLRLPTRGETLLPDRFVQKAAGVVSFLEPKGPTPHLEPGHSAPADGHVIAAVPILRHRNADTPADVPRLAISYE